MLEADGDSRKHRPGALFESVVLSAAAIAFGCVAFADFLNHSFKSSDQMAVAAANKSGDPALRHGPSAGIDYSATGSIVSLRQAQPQSPCGKN